MATMRSLGFSIFSTYDGSGVRQARNDINGFNNDLNRSGTALNSWQGRLIAAAKAAAVFGPALIPIAANLAAVGGAAVAMSASVGTAMGAYGLAVKNAINETNKMAEAGKKLSAAQKDFISSQNAFNKAMTTFGSSFRDESLKAASATLNGMTSVLKGLEPVARALAPEVTKVAQAFENWAKSPQFKAYVDMIKASAVPAFRDLVAAGKDVLNVLGDGFRAFLPLGTQLAAKLREGAAALRAWSDGGGFQRFLEYVSQNSGPVKEFFKALGDAMSNIGTAMKDLAPGALRLSTAILQLVAALPPSWITAIVQGFVAWRTAMMALSIITTVVSAVRALAGAWMVLNLAFTASTIGLVVLAIAALVAGIILLIKHWDTVSGALSTAWNATWNAMKVAVEAVWNALKIGWAAVAGAFTTAWQAVSTALVTAWNAVWNAMSTAVQAVWTALQTAWNAVVMAFSTAWTAVSTALVTAWNTVWQGMSTAVQAVWTALQTAWNAVCTAFTTAWTTVSTALSAAWSTFWNGLQTAASTVWTALQTAWSAFITALQTVWTTVSTALVSAWQTVWSGIQTAAETVWNALRTAWEALVNAFQTAWTTVSSALQSAWQTFWNALQTAAQTVWTALQTAWDTFLNAVQTAWNTISSALQSAWQTFWTALQTAAQTIWTALQTAWQTFLTAVQTIWTTVSTALQTAWQTFWTAIQTAAQTIWTALQTAWQAFLNLVTTIWNTFKDALTAAWNAFWNAIRDAARAVWTVLTDAWRGFFTNLTNAWDTFKEAFQKAWEATWNTVRNIARDIWNSIAQVIERAINGIIGIINGLIKGFNRITDFLEINVKISEIGTVNVPTFADGGMVMFKYGGITGMPKKGCQGHGCGYSLGGPVNLRHGGTLSGYAPGRDTVPAMLSKGEGVLTPEAVRGLGGPAFVNGANRKFAGHRGAGKGSGPMFRPSVPLGREAYANGGMVQHFAVGGMTADALSRAGVPLSMVSQGEYSDGSLSAGTHLGGGAVDISSTDPGVLSRLIAAGFAAWIRGPENGMSPHIHAVLMNHPDLSGPARAQVADFMAGGDGLGAGGGGGGGGIDIVGMIAPHVGKILLNVYRGLAPLAGIAGTIASFFGGGTSLEPNQDQTSQSAQERRRELMERAERGDQDAIRELARGAAEGTLDRDAITVQPAPFTGRPPVAIARNGADTAIGPNSNSLLANLAKFVLPLIKREDIATGLGDAKKEVDGFNIGGGFGKIAQGFGTKLIDDVIPDYVMKKAEAATLPTLTMGGGGNVQQWAGLAAQALQMAGLNSNQLQAFLALMAAESGGNPNAINTTDINARNGNPSQGLMQVTGTTFAAYRDPSLPNNPRDPLANMVAAANYIKARYGGNVPGSPYADGTSNATPGLHLVGEEGPELVGMGGPMMAAFGGGETVLPAGETAALLSGSGVPVGAPSESATGDVTLPEDETQQLLNNGGFEGISEAAQIMAQAVEAAWREANAASAQQWALMRDTTMAEAAKAYGADMVAAATLMKDTSNLAWLDMNTQSATQWALMRDTTFLEAETKLGTQMPLMITTMQTAWATAWLDMQTQATTQWATLLEGVFLPMEEHMGVTMVEAATTMNESVSEAFTAMGEVITEVLDAGIAKMDEFIAKAQEAIEVTAELVAAVQEAQAAMAQIAAMGTAGAGGAAGGAGGSYEAIAAEALAAAGISADQLPAFMALMQAESGGDPNAINNWDSNAAAGTPSMGLMQMIQPTFDAYNVTGGNIMDPRANMFASAAYIADRYGGIVPGSPYRRGTNSATPGMHLVGEEGPELVGMNGPEYAWFRGGERVLTNADTAAVMAQQALIPILDQTIVSIDQFIAVAKQAIERAKQLVAAAQAAAAAGARGMGNGSCAMPNAPVTQGPNNPGGVAASAGTHDGAGVYDFGTTDPATLQFLRDNGWAAWARGNGDGMSPHIHAVCMNASGLSPQAAWQVQDYLAGGSGLGIPGNLHTGTMHASKGWSWVGERGPELMRMGGGERVKSHLRSRNYMDSINSAESAHSGSGDHENCSGHFEFNFNGPVNNGDDVRRALDEAIPKLRSAVQARSGARSCK